MLSALGGSGVIRLMSQMREREHGGKSEGKKGGEKRERKGQHPMENPRRAGAPTRRRVKKTIASFSARSVSVLTYSLFAL